MRWPSTTATRLPPGVASRPAATSPAGPAPTTITSNSRSKLEPAVIRWRGTLAGGPHVSRASSPDDLADDRGLRHRAPVAAVVRGAAIVAQQEPLAGRNLSRGGEVALLTAPAGRGEWLGLTRAVAHAVAVEDGDRVAGSGHH